MQTTRRLHPTAKCFHIHCCPAQYSRTSVAEAARCYTNSKEQGRNEAKESSNHDVTDDDKTSGQDLQQKTERSTQSQEKKYYSLKNHRDGPNTESGEVDTQQNQEDVKIHNKDLESRHRKIDEA